MMYNRPHWSYSAINQYLSCPLRYYFQRILCLPQPSISSNLVLGSSVHAALAKYHLGIQQNEKTSIEDLRSEFAGTWTRQENQAKVSFKDGENSKEAFEMGMALVNLYLKEPPPQNIIGVEQHFISPVHNSRGEYLENPLVAVADLVTRKGEGVTIIELKTSGRAYSELEAETSLQPICYVNAAQELFGCPASVEYTVLTKTKIPKIQRLEAKRTDADLGRLGDIIENIEKAILADIFYPVETPMNCSACPYRKPCRSWGRGNPCGGMERHFLPPEVSQC